MPANYAERPAGKSLIVDHLGGRETLMKEMKKTNWLAGCLCGLVALFCIVLIDPRAEIGLNDDWSYIFTAKRLAETGHVLYNGWATAMLGVQLYLGAFFIRLFGFSFLTVRASGMVLFIASTVLTQAILTRCGIRPWNATLGALTLMLSPLYLPLATMYMSDAFAMSFVLLFFYAAVRCTEAETPRSTWFWLLAATAASLAGGSVRQIAFLCNLVAVPALVWRLRHRRGVVALGLFLWLTSTILTFAMIHWFNTQPYTLIDVPYTLHRQGRAAVWLASAVERSFVECLLLLLPVVVAIALKFPFRQEKMLRQLLLLVGAIACLVGMASFRFGGEWWGRRWLLGNIASAIGVAWDLLGPHPTIVPASVEIIVAFLSITTAVVAAWTILHCLRHGHGERLSNLDRSLLAMSIPFAGAYLILVFTRRSVYDRYFVPILFLAILFSLRWFERRFATAVSWLSLVPLAALAFYGVAATHDRFASARAVVAAAAELRAAGVPRNQIDGGFEYNGWTEIEANGYMNEPSCIHRAPTIRSPFPQALMNMHPADGSEHQCYSFLYTYAPSIHAHYVLQRTSNYCFPDSSFAPVLYRTWLRPYNNTIYIAEIRQPFR